MSNTRAAVADAQRLHRHSTWSQPRFSWARTFTSGEATFSIDRCWEAGQRRRLAAHLHLLQTQRQGETCVIAGNGPSLNQTALDEIGDLPLMISNFAFTHASLAKKATHLAIVNHLVAEQRADEMATFYEEQPRAAPGLRSVFAPTHLAYALPRSPLNQFVRLLPTPAFEIDLLRGASCQSTVTYFLLQIAYAIGYRRVLLIGVDNRYVQPEHAREGDVIEQRAPDPNHFSTDYFQHARWHAADVDRMAAVYQQAKSAYTADGREVIDCTHEGALRVFPRAAFAAACRAAASRGATARAAGPEHSSRKDWATLALDRAPLVAGLSMAALVALAGVSLSIAIASTPLMLAALCLSTLGSTAGAVLLCSRMVRNTRAHHRFEQLVLHARLDRIEQEV